MSTNNELLIINYINGFLHENDFSDINLKKLDSFIVSCEKNKEMKKLISAILFDKALSLLNLVTIEGKQFLIRNYFKFIISLNNDEIIKAIETYFVSSVRLDGFFIFVDELLKAKKDITSCIYSFNSLILIRTIHIDYINSFLKIIKKDHKFMINELLNDNFFKELNYYLDRACQFDSSKAEEMSKIIKSNENLIRENYDYNAIAATIITYNSFCAPILLEPNIEFEIYILAHIYNIPLLKNYSNYLNNISHDKFLAFEKFLLEKMNSYVLVRYAESVLFSSKKLILQKLIELKHETYLIEFIKLFPKYGHLLPML